MLLMPLLEYHHFLLTRVTILPSPSIQNTNWLPELTNLSLIFLNFTKNSRRLSFYPRNITNTLQIKIGSLLQTSKSVTKFSLKLSFSIQPIQQRNSPKNILVPTRSLTKPGPLSWTLHLPDSMHAIHPIFHVSMLEPSTLNSIPDHIQPPLPPVLIDGQPEYERNLRDPQL